MSKKRRYKILDILRGVTLIQMILYHGIWDLVYIFDKNFPWYEGPLAYLWQQSICWTFILLSGFCWSFDKNKLKRGGLVFSCGIVITMITILFLPSEKIIFGILTFLGSSMLLMIPFHFALKKVNPTLGFFLSLLLFFLFRNINIGYLGFEQWNIRKLPEHWYHDYFTAFIGFPSVEFQSTDYFSLFPWFFLFLTGYFLYHWLQQKNKLDSLYSIKLSLPIIEWLGRTSLLVYMLHQPVVYGILCLVNLIQ